jgi:hypothetical protein
MASPWPERLFVGIFVPWFVIIGDMTTDPYRVSIEVFVGEIPELL